MNVRSALSLAVAVVAQLPFFALAAPAAAAAGALDLSFNATGKVTTDIGAGTSDEARAMAVQADGRIVVAGGSENDFALVRYNANGSLDTTFDTDGKVTTDTGNAGLASTVAVQADGKIVTSGISDGEFAVVRYNRNGSLDTTFDSDGMVRTILPGAFNWATAMAIQADGRIVAGGNAGSDFALVRYNSNGSLDTTFHGDGWVTTDVGTGTIDHAYSLVIQPDGRIVAAGVGDSDFAVVRYNANGSLDTTFDSDGRLITDIGASTTDVGWAVALAPDGRIVVSGTTGGATFDIAVVRYNPNGSLDATFDTDGKVITDIGAANQSALAVAVQADGKIVAVGFTGSALGDFVVVRYAVNGSLDTSFNGGGIASTDLGTGENDFARATALQADGKILAAGFGGSDIALVRYEGDPSVSITDATVTEGDAANVAMFTVTLSTASASTVTVNYATVDGTASSADYAGVSGSLTFAPGEVTTSVSVAVKDDDLVEGSETFRVNLSSPTNVAVLARTQAIGTILDNDRADPDPIVSVPPARVPGYWIVASDGGIFAFDAPFSGSAGAVTLHRPIVGMAADPDGTGYWLVASDGGIFAFDAPFFGSTGALQLNKPIVAMAASPTGKGYYLVASDGGVFAFGDAVFGGSTGAMVLNTPIVSMSADRDGAGYYLVASDGGIFAFDAAFKGSTGSHVLNKPIVSMAADADGSGYYLVASDGGIFAFDAVFKGSTGAITLNKPIAGMAVDRDGSGYYLVASDGGIFAFDARFKGSTGATTLNKPIVGMAART